MIRHILLSISLALLSSAAFAGRTITVRDTAGYHPPMLGNGWIGSRMTAGGLAPEAVYSHGVRRSGSPEHVSTITPATIPISLTVNGKILTDGERWQQTLDMDSAEVVTTAIIDGVECRATFIVPRQYPNMMFAELRLKALRPAEITIVNHPDIPLENLRLTRRTVWCEDGGRRLLRAEGTAGGKAVVASAGFIAPEQWTISADTATISLQAGQATTIGIMASIVSQTEFSDPWNESERQVIYVSRLGTEPIKKEHRRRWHDLWQGNVVIDGDERLQSIADVAIYNLYSSIRENSGQSIAPMGLTSDKYYGHIFWDADLWIMPVLAVLQPELARQIVDYRINNLEAACHKAQTYGYQGAMFPWESDYEGEESTPTFALTGPLEHHITAVVTLAAWNYYRVTHDLNWLHRAYPMMKACADFWTSRVEKNDDATYSIKNVVGADEYAIGVNDNAFTNAATREALRATTKAAELLDVKPDSQWIEIAEAIRIPTLGDGIIAEYEGYDGAMIKQADVTLLAYPLGLISDPQQVKRNIDFYDRYLDRQHGPAMSHAVTAVNFSRIGEGEQAYTTLMQGINPYLVGPFLSIAETPSNGETYFMTGAGAILQGIIFGLAGIDITDNGIEQLNIKNSMPPHIKNVVVNRPQPKP